jgi:hypothetical protein
VRIRDGELWCANCGEVIHRIHLSGQDSDDLTFSRCCRKPRPVPAASVLREGEYLVEYEGLMRPDIHVGDTISVSCAAEPTWVAYVYRVAGIAANGNIYARTNSGFKTLDPLDRSIVIEVVPPGQKLPPSEAMA